MKERAFRITGPIRIGFIGAGNIVRQRHVPGLKMIAGVEMAGVVNSTAESSARAAAEFGIARTYETPEQLIESDEIDVVWIGTQPYLHSRFTVAALEAGKHVFCQARMAMDYRDARVMYDAWRRSGLTAGLCPPPGFLRGDRVVRRLLREGFVGRLYHVTIRSYDDGRHDPARRLHWRESARISGVNVMDVGMKVEVAQRWLNELGSGGNARRVVAHAATAIPERPPMERGPSHGETKVERPDGLTLAAELQDGAVLSGLWSDVARFGDEGNGIELYGSEGAIRYASGGAGKIMAGRAHDAALQEVPVSDDEARAWTVEADFIAAVRSGKRDPEPSFWDGLKYMELTDAIVRSAAEGRAIDLPYDRNLESPSP